MMYLSEIAQATNGTLHGEDVWISQVGTDSRAISAGQLFVALKGERFDGHAYVEASLAQGAHAALVSEVSALPCVQVTDTRLALGRLAAYWRQKFSLPLVGITGSNGKTSVKEMLVAILAAEAGETEQVLATQGNLNNDIGMPLTLLRLRAQHRFAVIEMGMNHQGEIRYLTQLARPDVVVINNAGTAHIGELGSVEAIAYAKGEILEGLSEQGIAVLNADDAYFSLWQRLNGARKIVRFGLDHEAEVSAEYTLGVEGSTLEVHTPLGPCAVNLQVPGLHNVKNALAAIAAALQVGASLASISSGLERYTGVKGRLQPSRGYAGAWVIDDTYNANPSSMMAAIDVLSRYPGETCFVMGDMGELGDTAESMHRQVGAYAKQRGIAYFMATGSWSALAVEAFGEGACHFQSREEVAEALKTRMHPNMTVLVKGSRFMGMERVVALLVAEKKGEHNVA